MALGGAGLTAMAGKTMTVYRDYQDAIAYTGAIAGATTEEMEAMNQAAMAAGAGTSKTATEAAQALGYMSLAGWDVKRSTSSLMPVLKLAEATQMELATCSNLVTSTMATMGLQTDDLSGYLDVLCKTNNKSATTAQELMEAIAICGGTMKGLKIDVQDTATALGVLANRHITSAEAGNSLNSIIANMKQGTGEAKKALDELGISIESMYDQNGAFQLEKTLMRIDEATKNLSADKKNQLIGAIGGKEQAKTLNALLDGIREAGADGRTEWQALNDEIRNSGGALDEMRDKMTKTMGYAMKTFGSSLENAMLQIGSRIEPMITPVINSLSNELLYFGNEIVPKIANEMEYVGNTIKDNWGTIKPIVEGIGIAFGTWKLAEFILGLPQVISGIKSMIVAQKALTAAKIADKIETIQIQALYWKDILLNAKSAVAMGARTAATTVMTAATAAWGAVCTVASAATTALGAAFAFLTSPIGLTVAAIAAVIAIGVYLYKNWDAVKQKAAELYAAFAEKFPGIAAVIEKVFTTLGPKVQALVAAIGERFGKIKDWFAQKWTEAVQFLGGLMAGASEIATAVSAFISPIVQTIVTGFQTAYQWVSNLFITIGGYVSTGIGYLTQFVAFIGEGFSAVLQIYLDAAAAVFGSFSASISAVIDAVITTIGGIIDFLTGVFTGNWSMAWQGIVDAFGGIFSGIQALATAPINGVIALLNSLIGKINSVSFDVPPWVPGVGGKHFGFDVPSLPALAEGGIATAPTLAMIGEGAESEAVLPLSKLDGLLSGRGGGSSTAGGESGSIVFSPQITINGGGSKEETMQAMNEAFSQFKAFMARYEREHKRFAFSQ